MKKTTNIIIKIAAAIQIISILLNGKWLTWICAMIILFCAVWSNIIKLITPEDESSKQKNNILYIILLLGIMVLLTFIAVKFKVLSF